MPVTGTYWPLDLRHAAVDEQLDTIDVAAVVRRQEDGGFADVVRSPDPTQRYLRLKVTDHPGDLIRWNNAVEHGRIGRARAEDIHSNAPFPKIQNPAPCKIANGRLRGAIDTEGRIAGDGPRRSPEND